MTDKKILKQVVDINKNQPAIDADQVLEKSKGTYKAMLVIGYNQDGYLEVNTTKNLDCAQVLWLIENYKKLLLEDEYYDEE